MIPSLVRFGSPLRPPEWPDVPGTGQRSGAVFEERPPLRKLVVLADAELLNALDRPEPSRVAVLRELLAHPYIRLYRYSDEGPPAGTPRASRGPGWRGLGPAEGWAELLPADSREGRWVLYLGADGPVTTGTSGRHAAYARRDTRVAAYQAMDPVDAANRRERDALAVELAEAVGADLFVTERPYLLAPKKAAYGSTVCDVPEALAAVGLYLRTQKRFTVTHLADGSGLPFSGFFYWFGAWQLLPEARRWAQACAEQSATANDNTLQELAHSLVHRCQRALEARDRLHRAISLTQTNDTGREVLAELDAILVTLMGAVDASARVAHIVLGVPGKRHDSGWQRDRWLAKVAKCESSLANLFADTTPLQATLTILTSLRNTVHGQMIRSTLIQNAGRRQTAVLLPTEQEPAILDAMKAGGGSAAWGVHSSAGRQLVDPGRFVEKLFPSVLELLNDVLRETPVERLAQGHRAPDDRQPSAESDQTADIFSDANRLSIRWQLGF